MAMPNIPADIFNAIDRATTRAALGALYAEWVGYDITQDQPDISDDEVRARLEQFAAVAWHDGNRAPR